MRSCVLVLMIAMATACGRAKVSPAEAITAADLYADTSMIPRDTIPAGELTQTREGILLYGNRKFSGYALTRYADQKVRSIASVYEGMLHGITRSYYENGQLHEARQYKSNFSTGKHYGYWPNGKRQFDYIYYRDRKIGAMKRWYENGKPYLFLQYSNDREEGLQQGWRENGKLFINYVAKDGYRYGLQETMLCYKLDEGKIIK